jgi:hypothetical protein
MDFPSMVLSGWAVRRGEKIESEVMARLETFHAPEQGQFAVPVAKEFAAVLGGLAGASTLARHATPGEAEGVCRAEGPPPTEPGNSIRQVGDIWHLRYQDESGDYPAKDNQALGWLAQLLAAPGRHLTVADVRGEPEGKLRADATPKGERLIDAEGLELIWKRLQEKDHLTENTGPSEKLEEERADLLRAVKEWEKGKQVQTPLTKGHHNIATQLETDERTANPSRLPLAAKNPEGRPRAFRCSVPARCLALGKMRRRLPYPWRRPHVPPRTSRRPCRHPQPAQPPQPLPLPDGQGHEGGGQGARPQQVEGPAGAARHGRCPGSAGSASARQPGRRARAGSRSLGNSACPPAPAAR